MQRKGRGKAVKRGATETRQFVRRVVVLDGYNDVRATGNKHSVAVAQTVDLVQKRYPDMPISESCVRREVASFRSSKSRNQLRVARSIMSDQETLEMQNIIALMSVQQKDTPLPDLPEQIDRTKTFTKFAVSVVDRIDYPRCNRKAPKI